MRPAEGIGGRRWYRDEADRRRFLGLVADLPERFGLEVHAFVLMDNHYHLLVRTPQPNLSHAMGWLHVSYSSRFNWAHRLCGHVFQGRFKALVIEDEAGVVKVARYGRHRLAEVVRKEGAMKYQAAAQAVRRFEASVGKDPGRARFVERMKRSLKREGAERSHRTAK